jgi:energy-coupling factor transporter transmembrane protein EcfT
MKSSQLFWGFFFISFGALYLVGRYTAFIIDWYAIWDLWPVIIILAGVSIILKGTLFKPVVSVLMGIILAFLVFGFFNDMFNVFEDRDFRIGHSRSSSENYYNLDYNNSIDHVNLNINVGAGKFNLEKTTDDLMTGYSKGNIAGYKFSKSQEDSIAWVDLTMEEIEFELFNTSLKNQFKLSLNDNPTYNLNLEIGAAKSYFNLIPFKVKNLVLQTGATDTKIKFGDKSEMVYVNVEIGAAALKIYIPKTSGCKINGEMILMETELDDFEKYGSDYYVTENFENATEKIIMEINGGVSSFEVKRY